MAGPDGTGPAGSPTVRPGREAPPVPQESRSLHAEVTGFTRLILDAAPAATIAVVGPNGAARRRCCAPAWPGTAADGTLGLADGGRLVVADSLAEGAAALAIIAPEAVSVHEDRPGEAPVTSGQERFVSSPPWAAGSGW